MKLTNSKVEVIAIAIGLIFVLVGCYGCSSKTSKATGNTTDTLDIKDNVAFNKEYAANPDTFKKKYLNQYAKFVGFFYQEPPVDKPIFLLKYPNYEKVGTDPIQIVELRFNTPIPKNVPYSDVASRVDVGTNKYWIFDAQDKKLIEETNSHTNRDVNEEPLSFYKAKLVEYIDEPSTETRELLLGYYDNALKRVFSNYSQLFYKPTNEDDFDYKHTFILSTVTIKGKISEINVGADGMVWIKLSDEKITKVQNGFTMDGAKLIDVGALKGTPNSAPDTVNR